DSAHRLLGGHRGGAGAARCTAAAADVDALRGTTPAELDGLTESSRDRVDIVHGQAEALLSTTQVFAEVFEISPGQLGGSLGQECGALSGETERLDRRIVQSAPVLTGEVLQFRGQMREIKNTRNWMSPLNIEIEDRSKSTQSRIRRYAPERRSRGTQD